MKKTTILCLLFAFAGATFCQQTDQNYSATQTDYFNKSKQQKGTGWVLLIGGTVVLAATTVASAGIDFYHKRPFPIVPVCVGASMMVASIPFFVASGKNKRRANNASVFINAETKPVLQGIVFTNRSFPTIAFRISL